MAYSAEQKRAILDEIYRLMSVEGKSLLEICKMDGMPDRGRVYVWIDELGDEEHNKYARAMERRALYLFDEIQQIADNPVAFQTHIKRTGGEFGGGSETITADSYQHRRLQIDARKWKLSKMMPERFGDKLDLTSKGEKIQSAVVEVTFGDGGERSTENNG